VFSQAGGDAGDRNSLGTPPATGGGFLIVHLLGDGKSAMHSIGAGQSVLGRDQSVTVPIPDASVSKRHATLEVGASGAVLTDLGSRNGTWVNGEKVTKQNVAFGDLIRLGRVPVLFLRAGTDDDEFVATASQGVSAFDSHCTLVGTQGMREGEVFPVVEAEPVTLGSDPLNAIQIEDELVSGFHAHIALKAGRAIVSDLLSRDGVLVNDQRVESGELKNNDIVSVGGCSFRIEMAGVEAPQTTKTDDETGEFQLSDTQREAALARTSAAADALEVVPRSAVSGESETSARPSWTLVCTEGPDLDRRFILTGARLVIGRAPDIPLPLNDAAASRKHAEIEPDDKGIAIRDLGSRNGLEINGEKTRSGRLTAGDSLGLGRDVFVLIAGD